MQSGALNSIVCGTYTMSARSEASFTDAFIKSLKPAATRYDVYDKNLTGFGVRVSK